MIFTELNPGKSVEGQDIQAFRSSAKAEKYFYLIAGTHGDEVEGVYVLKELFDWIKNEMELPDLPMIVIPILNVDGYRTGTRVNSHQIDLNRNYPTKDWSPEIKGPKYNPGPEPLSEPENQYLNKLFLKYNPGFILSIHSWKPILNYNGNCQDVADFIQKFNNYPVEGDIGYPTPGSLGTYVPEKFQAGVLTYECPTLTDSGMSLRDIWLENEKGLKALFTSGLIEKKLS